MHNHNKDDWTTIIVASVAAIYGLTDPDEYKNLVFSLRVGEPFKRKDIQNLLINAIYERNNLDRKPGTFALSGDMLEIRPSSTDKYIVQVDGEDGIINEIDLVDITTGKILHTLESFPIYPAYEHASSFDRVKHACHTIRRQRGHGTPWCRSVCCAAGWSCAAAADVQRSSGS